ncbi:hypothetical protein KXR53_04170 [Inquilinus limosus]|uniref:hypothetical protein n=1 Tax=Inquilinus limosus TaxID=171674 RepID=UPI003F16D0F1
MSDDFPNSRKRRRAEPPCGCHHTLPVRAASFMLGHRECRRTTMRRPPIDLTTLLLAAAAAFALALAVLGVEPTSGGMRSLHRLVGPDLYPYVSRGIFGFGFAVTATVAWLSATDRLRLDRWTRYKRRQVELIDHAIRRDP